jgi:hypothetical protein
MKITPDTNEYKFTQNTSRVDSYNGLESFKNGYYYITSSSIADVSHNPYHVFNDSQDNYWQSKNSFNNANPSSIKKTENTNLITEVQLNYDNKSSMYKNYKIEGEWIQIKLPYKVILSEYSILIPPQNSNKIRKFFVVGSNDGMNWVLLDSRDLFENNLDSNNLTYSVLVLQKFSFFRLIISELFSGENVSISQWKLFGDKSIHNIGKGNINANVSVQGNINANISTEKYFDNSTIRYNGIIDALYFKNEESFIPKIENKKYDLYINMDESNNYQPFSTNEKLYEQFIIVDGNVDTTHLETFDTSNKADAYFNNVYEIEENGKKIAGNIASFKEERDSLMKDKKYDFTGNVLIGYNSKPTITDALKEDIDTMVIQQNNIYILGTMTLAILLVGTFVFVE